jgi:hypothetical protein
MNGSYPQIPQIKTNQPQKCTKGQKESAHRGYECDPSQIFSFVLFCALLVAIGFAS